MFKVSQVHRYVTVIKDHHLSGIFLQAAAICLCHKLNELRKTIVIAALAAFWIMYRRLLHHLVAVRVLLAEVTSSKLVFQRFLPRNVFT